MTDVYSLEDKISNIRKVVRNLTGDCYSTHEYKQVLLKEVNSNSSRNSPNSLENFLEGKFEDRQKPQKKIDLTTNHTYEYEKEEKYSRDSFKGPYSNKIMTSFLSEDFSSLKMGESDLAALLENERENVRKLEQRVLQKDEIIDAMNKRQMSLTDELAAVKRLNSREEIEEYKAMVSNLQEKLEKYMNQVNFLQNQHRPGLKKFSSEEELLCRVSSLERQLADQTALMEELHSKGLKIKQDQMLISDLKIQIEKKDRTIAELVNENKEFNARINEMNLVKKDSRQDFREFKLREEVNRLKQVNEELFVKCREIGKGDVDKRDKSAEPRKRSLFVEDKKGEVNRRTDNEKVHLDNGERPKRDYSNQRRRSCSSQRVLIEIVEMLKCGKSEIVHKLKRLKRSEKLEKRLQSLIQDLSAQKSDLSTKQVWKCITKLVEEYILLKKDSTGGLGKIAKMLGVREGEVVGEVRKISEEQKKVNGLVEKIKKMLCLSPHAALHEVEDTLDEKSGN